MKEIERERKRGRKREREKGSIRLNTGFFVLTSWHGTHTVTHTGDGPDKGCCVVSVCGYWIRRCERMELESEA